MPWTDLTPMDQRLELVTLALSGEFTVTELASRFGVSKKTAHKWIGRYEAGGAKALEDQSRAPRHSPQKTPDDMERLIVKLKRAHPTWGPKKIRNSKGQANYFQIHPCKNCSRVQSWFP